MDTTVTWKSAALQAVLVAGLSVVLALALPHSFFEDWGWLAGPAAWAICALLTARLLSLPLAATLLGAALAGIPSAIAVLVGAHWLGAAFAVVLFGCWCGVIAARGIGSQPPEPA